MILVCLIFSNLWLCWICWWGVQEICTSDLEDLGILKNCTWEVGGLNCSSRELATFNSDSSSCMDVGWCWEIFVYYVFFPRHDNGHCTSCGLSTEVYYRLAWVWTGMDRTTHLDTGLERLFCSGRDIQGCQQVYVRTSVCVCVHIKLCKYVFCVWLFVVGLFALKDLK